MLQLRVLYLSFKRIKEPLFAFNDFELLPGIRITWKGKPLSGGIDAP